MRHQRMSLVYDEFHFNAKKKQICPAFLLVKDVVFEFKELWKEDFSALVSGLQHEYCNKMKLNETLANLLHPNIHLVNYCSTVSKTSEICKN